MKLALSDKDLLNGLLMKAPSANLRHVLYLLLEEQYVDILPNVLQRLYPTKQAFMEEDRILVDTAEHIINPVLHAIHQSKGHYKGVPQCFRNFLGEYFPQFMSDLPSHQRLSLLDGILTEDDSHELYEALPSLFTGISFNGEDMFAESLLSHYIPLSLKRKIIKNNLPQLKTLEMQHSGIPYFWELLFSGEESRPLIKELVEEDPSLLHLKSLEGLTLQHLLAVFPKGDANVRFLKQLFTSGKADMALEVLPNHVVVHSFREIVEQLGNQKIHLWSDIDEVMIFDKHFWRYDSFRDLIPFEWRAQLGEYDHALLDEEAPSIFNMILQNKGRINGLTARPPEEQKFKSTHRRLSQSGFTFAGTQGMESIFTKENFPHFDHDIFFCGNRDKGEVVLEAIEALYGETETKDLPLFVFPDDLVENLFSVSEVLKDTRYKFMLYYFRAIDRKLAPYSENKELLLSAIKEFQTSDKTL